MTRKRSDVWTRWKAQISHGSRARRNEARSRPTSDIGDVGLRVRTTPVLQHPGIAYDETVALGGFERTGLSLHLARLFSLSKFATPGSCTGCALSQFSERLAIRLEDAELCSVHQLRHDARTYLRARARPAASVEAMCASGKQIATRACCGQRTKERVQFPRSELCAGQLQFAHAQLKRCPRSAGGRSFYRTAAAEASGRRAPVRA
jgi:hypothetical protein